MSDSNLRRQLNDIYQQEIAKRVDISQYFSLMDSASRGRAKIGVYSGPNRLSNIVASEDKHTLNHVDLRDIVNYSTSNYLGLGQHPEVVSAAADALTQFGTGSNGSPILSGYYRVHHELERQLSIAHGYEDTMLTSSGFIANQIVMTSLFTAGDTIYLEKNTHGSIIMGANLSGARVRLYSENEFERLEKLLRNDQSRRKLVVTCGVFSMTGLISDLPQLSNLVKKYDALLMVDDAHAMGVLGENGLGTVDHFNMDPNLVDIHVGTLSKSLSACGGYVSASREIIQYLRLSALPYLLSASLPPVMTAAALQALAIVQEFGSTMAAELRDRVQFFKTCLLNQGIEAIGESAIVVIPVGNTEDTMRISNHLHQNGIYANGIVAPGVRRGEERMRFNVTLTHSYDDLEYTAVQVAKAVKNVRVIDQECVPKSA